MDPVMIEKLHAMKRYRSSKKSFVHGLMKCAFSIFFLGVFLSCPLWLPKLFNSWVIRCLFIFAPTTIKSCIMSTKCLFVLCNIIVIVLIGDSKRLGGAVPVTDIYEEYVRKNKRSAVVRPKKVIFHEPKTEKVDKEEEEEPEEEEGCCVVDEDGSEEEEEDAKVEAEEGISFVDHRRGEEENPDELNKRVENFIAMMNNQFKEEWR